MRGSAGPSILSVDSGKIIGSRLTRLDSRWLSNIPSKIAEIRQLSGDSQIVIKPRKLPDT